jgi:glucose-6-phosphate dehydrogenase assembly protein OpcA
VIGSTCPVSPDPLIPRTRTCTLFLFKSTMSTASTEPDYAILGQEVPLGRVDKALKELWGADDARDKASLMNFAIYSEDPASIVTNTDLLAQITKEHACRGLLILNRPAPEDPSQSSTPRSRAWITAHCQLIDGRKSVCSEQVSFVLEGGRANQVRNTVFAHLDSDLPLVFWWQGDLTDQFDERLYNVIDLLFIDSSRWSNAEVDFERLLSAESKDAARFRVYDLSWLRSHFIRTALASCFQAPLALAELPKLNQMIITHGPGHRVAGLLLAAWVGVRLKASVEDRPEGPALVLPEGQSIAIKVKEGSGSEPLQSIVLSSPQASFSVERACGSSYVCAKVSLPDHSHEELLPADLPTDAALIANLLSRLGRQSLYLQMVPTLQRLLGCSGNADDSGLR